jgi:hypothetical protein
MEKKHHLWWIIPLAGYILLYMFNKPLLDQSWAKANEIIEYTFSKSKPAREKTKELSKDAKDIKENLK